jgi:hypothetical protein
MGEQIIQVAIPVISGSSIWLLSRHETWRRWGFIVGLAGQPLWFYTTIKAAQWGIFALSVWFTYAHVQGIYNFWLRRR